MNYKNTKQAMLTAYPRLFIDEADVLHHLFFVLGNGYAWYKGQLTDGSKSVKAYIKCAEDSRRAYRINDDFHPEGATVEELNAKEIEYRLSAIKEIGTDCWFLLSDGRIGKKMYPISEYAKILNIPKDIKNDWLAAAKKAISLSKSDMFRTTDKDKHWIQIAEERIESLRK